MEMVGLLLLVALLSPGSDGVPRAYTSHLTVVAVRNEAIILQCMFSVTPGPIDPKRVDVTWYQYGFPVAMFQNGVALERHDAYLSESDIRQGNASLLLKPVAKRDEGQYECEIAHGGKKHMVSMSLTVRVPPKVVVFPERVQLLTENSVTCAARSFYPKAISFTWMRNGHPVKEMNSTTPQINRDGTYNSESVYRFTARSRDELSCVVEHEALEQPLRRFITYLGRTVAEMMTVIIPVLLVFIVLLLVCWWSSVLLSPLAQSKVNNVEGEQAEIQCTLKSWTLTLVTLQWFLNSQKISLDQKGPPAYTLKGDTEEKGNRLKKTTILLFTASRKDHAEAELRCRATHRLTRRSVERSVMLGQVYARPQLSDIENISEYSDADVKLQITAEEFYPRDIGFTWTLGEERGTTEMPEIIDNPDGTFSARSICSVPLSWVQMAGFRVSVEVDHISQGKLLRTATGDTPGIDGRPLLSDIQVVRFTKLGEPCNLSCTVSRFFPSAVTVTWLRAKAEGGHQPVTAGSPHWTATVNRPTPEKRNNIYEVTSEVQFTPKQLSEFEEMTYICRVGHMTLMGQPIEKTAGNLELEGCQKMPRAMDLKIHFVELNQPCILSCTITDFYPKEIKVTWLRRDKEKKQWEAGTPQWKATTAHYGPSMRKNTFDLVTQVKFTPMQLSELEDMEFFCTVQHLSITGKYMERSSAGVYIPGWLLAQQAKKFGTTAGYVDNNEKGFTSNLYFGDD
uniref:Uncharacterized LOC114661616 n=1 Tax=Erpetoichthys calabaricus TaxID=27687 RepID=A0A8C4SSA5_ERPCA